MHFYINLQISIKCRHYVSSSFILIATANMMNTVADMDIVADMNDMNITIAPPLLTAAEQSGCSSCVGCWKLNIRDGRDCAFWNCGWKCVADTVFFKGFYFDTRKPHRHREDTCSQFVPLEIYMEVILFAAKQIEISGGQA